MAVYYYDVPYEDHSEDTHKEETEPTNKTLKWIEDHIDEIAIGGAVAVALGAGIGAGIIGYNKTKTDFVDKSNRVYSNKDGFYYFLKRKMSNIEKLEYSRRLDAGERAGDILYDMGLLKGR